MILSIDTGSRVPPFEQLRLQVIDAVNSNAVAAGTKLPTVRRLATELGIAPGTVARAYRELEADGFIVTRGRNGTFVASRGDGPERHARDAAVTFAARIRQLGIEPERALDLARAAFSAEPQNSGIVSPGRGERLTE